MNKKILQRLTVTNTWSIQHIPMFQGCTIANKQNVEPWKLSTSWGHTKVCLHVVNILIIEIVSQTRCFVMWYINVIFIKFIKFTTYENVLI